MIRLDDPYILAYQRPRARKIILSEVITRYTLVDEHLNLPLCHCLFGRKKLSIQP